DDDAPRPDVRLNHVQCPRNANRAVRKGGPKPSPGRTGPSATTRGSSRFRSADELLASIEPVQLCTVVRQGLVDLILLREKAGDDCLVTGDGLGQSVSLRTRKEE